jgi:hypothetical protein
MSASEKNFPGRPLNRSARVWNKLIDKANEPKKSGIIRDPRDNGVDVQIRNDTGSNLTIGSAVAIDADGYILEWAESHYYSFWFAGKLPAATSNTFAITLQDIPSGEIGPARVSGRAMARVRFSSILHRRAQLTAGQTYLTSAQAVEDNGVKVIAMQATLAYVEQIVPVLMMYGRCLPSQLIRDIRISNDQLIKDIWYTYAPCDEYVPYVLADFSDCYVPYSPYAPAGTLQYFDDDFVLADHSEWDVPSPWEITAPGYDDSTALHFPGSADVDNPPAELTVTIGADGGFVQFRFTTSGSVGANVFIDGNEVVPAQSTGAGEWITVGPFALDAGSHTISFDETGFDGTCTYDDITVWGTE